MAASRSASCRKKPLMMDNPHEETGAAARAGAHRAPKCWQRSSAALESARLEPLSAGGAYWGAYLGMVCGGRKGVVSARRMAFEECRGFFSCRGRKGDCHCWQHQPQFPQHLLIYVAKLLKPCQPGRATSQRVKKPHSHFSLSLLQDKSWSLIAQKRIT